MTNHRKRSEEMRARTQIAHAVTRVTRGSKCREECRVNGPGEVIKKSHHTQPKCRGRRNLDSRENKRGNGAETQNIDTV